MFAIAHAMDMVADKISTMDHILPILIEARSEGGKWNDDVSTNESKQSSFKCRHYLCKLRQGESSYSFTSMDEN